MASLQEQLQSILSDPQAMSQITAVARALTGSPAPAGDGQTGALPPADRQGQDLANREQGPITGTGNPGQGEEEFLPVEGAGDGQGQGPAVQADFTAPKTGESGPETGGITPQTGGTAPENEGQNLDFSALLASLGGGMDPEVLSIALRVFGEYSAQDDDKAALLAALRPFLRPERQEKIEKAASIARLSRVVRVALALLREEGGHV